MEDVLEVPVSNEVKGDPKENLVCEKNVANETVTNESKVSFLFVELLEVILMQDIIQFLI